MTGLYQKYRPRKLADVVGQPEAVAAVGKFLKDGNVPHALMFTGGSGLGKTTLARIVASELKCSKFDLTEYNCATIKPMETVEATAKNVHYAPMSGPVRVWIWNETQALSRANFSQQGFLDILEDGPGHAYHVFTTTDPTKVLLPVRNRCTTINLKPVGAKDLQDLVTKVWKSEGVKNLSHDVRDKVVELADGSPRACLVLLEKVLGIKDEKGQLAQLEREGLQHVAFDLVKALMPFRGKPVWRDVAAVLKSVEGEEAEGLRRMVLATARTHLLKGGPMAPLAANVIQSFRDHVFDSGHAGLAVMCWEVVDGFK